MTMASTYEGLRKKSLDELKQEYDKLAKNTVIGLNFIHEEILRREQSIHEEKVRQEQNRRTREMKILTYVIAFLAVAQIFATIVSKLVD